METFGASVPADPALLFNFRQSLRSWLQTAQLEPDVQDALVLAVHEAVANGVEHGVGSPVRVEGRVDSGGLVVEVTTRGSWVAKQEGDEALAERGRGLTLMRGLTDELDVLVEGECVSIQLRPSHI